MRIKPFRWTDLKYVAKFGEFWAALAGVSAAAFLLGLVAG